MSDTDRQVQETADLLDRFRLGPKSSQLLHEVLQLITGSTGGVGGFIDRFRSAGLDSEVASWLGKTDGKILTAPQVEQALGSTTVGRIASRLGLDDSVVATAIGYIIPKLIGQITSGGVVPGGLRQSPSTKLTIEGAAATNSKPAAFVPRNAIIGVSIAAAAWCIIVGISFFTTSRFLTPLAIILGLGILPVAITSGYSSRG
jgi:uncharacterized protein YidB (DUF937 family)